MLKQQSKGFALVAAIFLLVAVGGVTLMMSKLSISQSSVNVFAAQNARATQAAYSGLEWAIFQRSSPNPNPDPCPSLGGTAVVTALAPINGMAVSVSCISPRQNYVEAGRQLQLATITVTAQFGELGDPDYVFKQVGATLEFPSTPIP